MWTLNLKNQTEPKQEITLSGGISIDEKLGGRGESYRLMVLNSGYIDIIDCSQSGDLTYHYEIYFNGNKYSRLVTIEEDITIDIVINNDATFTLNDDGKMVTGSLIPYPSVTKKDIESFDWMVDNKYIPYQNIPDGPGRTVEQLKALAVKYFPFSEYSFQLAMSIYDWTTADFTRIDFFKIFEYSGVPEKPLDMSSIAESIWTADWPPYTPANKDYMNSFMMQPASSLEDVTKQLNEKVESLRVNNDCELNIIEAALTAMPRTSIIKKPNLYSGQVSISNLGTQHFAAYFEEFPYNKSVGQSLEMPLDEALKTFIQVGKSLTLKNPMSFTDSQDDAMHYSNGIVLIANPKKGTIAWENTTYITPLSDGPDKIEYLFHPSSSFLIQKIQRKTINKKPIVEITLECT